MKKKFLIIVLLVVSPAVLANGVSPVPPGPYPPSPYGCTIWQYLTGTCHR